MINVLLSSVEYTSMVVAILSAVLGIVAVVFVVLLGMLLTRNAADKRRLSKDEYKRELVTAKQIRAEKREKKKKEGEPKLRHGKKNKQKKEAQ